MSGICGIIHWSKRPVDRDLLHRMAEAANHRGPNGTHYLVEDQSGFAHLAHYTTPESFYENQPICNKSLGLTLVADARVDNRDQLIRIFSKNGIPLGNIVTDAELILAAYILWDVDCARHIVGDFAFVIEDKKRHQIYAARDPRGMRPLYFRHSSDGFYWASEATQLLTDPDFEIKINESKVAHDLAYAGFSDRHETYYQHITLLEPGEWLLATETELKLQTYWKIDLFAALHYKSIDDYVEHFKSLFIEAVSSRLRTAQPICLFLSGGIDSSSIAATARLANTLLKINVDRKFFLLSFVSAKAPLTKEEIASRQTAEITGWDYHEINIDSHLSMFSDHPANRPHKDDPYDSPWRPLFVGALSEEIQKVAPSPEVVMLGIDGDALVGVMNPYFYLNQAKQRGLATALITFLQDVEQCDLKLSNIVNQFFIHPYIIEPIKYRLRPVREILKGGRVWLPPWISPQLIRRTNLIEWLDSQPTLFYFDPRREREVRIDAAKAFRYRLVSFPRSQRDRLAFDRLFNRLGSEYWAPWEDVRLVEFILMIPPDLVTRGLHTKIILRQAMKDLLPDQVLMKKGLKIGPEVWMHGSIRIPAIQQAIRALLENSYAEAMGFIDVQRLKSEIERRFSSSEPNFGISLWFPLYLEQWLRENFR